MTVGALPTREQAVALLHEWITNVNLRKHCYAVEAAMRAYARKFGEDEERWGLTGLIHDFDWERHPDLERHPMLGVEHLRALGWPDDVCRAVLGHAVHAGVPRDTPMAKTLYACDELCGFLVACALVTPGKQLAEVEPASVRKKMKRRRAVGSEWRSAPISPRTAKAATRIPKTTRFTASGRRPMPGVRKASEMKSANRKPKKVWRASTSR